MTWNIINSIVAVLSLILSGMLWYRTIMAENVQVDLIPAEFSADGKLLVLYLRVKNPGRHAMILHEIAVKSPPKDELLVASAGQDVRGVVDRVMKEQKRPGIVILNTVLEPAAQQIVQITLPDLDRSLDIQLRWSKQSPVVFPWRPKRIHRTSRELRQLADAASGTP